MTNRGRGGVPRWSSSRATRRGTASNRPSRPDSSFVIRHSPQAARKVTGRVVGPRKAKPGSHSTVSLTSFRSAQRSTSGHDADLADGAGDRDAEAEVRPVGEGEVPVRLAGHVEGRRVGELRLVAVAPTRRGRRCPAPPRRRWPLILHRLSHHPARRLHRAVVAHHLLGRRADQVGSAAVAPAPRGGG